MIEWKDLETDEGLMARFKKEFDACGSDKATHHYHRVYQHFLLPFHYLGREPAHLLEFGISNFPKEFERHSGSLFAWSRLYPKCKILGVDRDPDRMFFEANIATLLADQMDTGSLDMLPRMIATQDVIIDDASHAFRESVRTLEALYPKLRNGGTYFIEDVAKKDNGWQQTVADWEGYLPRYLPHALIVDAWPENPNDVDSVIVCIRK